MASAHPRTVFIVDDDAVVRDSLGALLQTRHYDTREFDSGRAFLARDPAVAGDCLILDVHMPDMDGLELLRTLRGQGNDIATVVITGRNDASITSQAKALGAVAVLDKPVSHTVLFPAIEQAVNRRA